jgi:hypothetical protein
MNSPRKFLVFIIFIVSGMALAQLNSVEAPPAQRLTTTSPVEQYRVIDPAMIPAKNVKDAPTAIENALNDLGAQGWRVRAGAGNYVILAR